MKASPPSAEYPYEDVREFVMRRSFLRGWRVTELEYDGLKARTADLPEERAAYLRAFIDGWLAAR